MSPEETAKVSFQHKQAKFVNEPLLHLPKLKICNTAKK
jgi:hypothetical protein